MSSVVQDSRPAEMQSTSEAEIASFGRKIIESGKDIGLLHLLPLPLPATSSSDMTLAPPLVKESIVQEIQPQPQPID